jgi:cellulose synthase/poly-beta-1,6-N-acetylglucosamine synthase-like glycosyltransferase
MFVVQSIYFAVAFILFLYGINCYYLLYLSKKSRKKPQSIPSWDSVANPPKVTTQLPIFNEAEVALRVIRAAVAMDYPKGLHEIQVLDDSTDFTAEMVRKEVEHLQQQGVNIKLLHRTDRVGFKAGAMAAAMTQTDSDLFAIFDADFIPPADFLKQLVPHFVFQDDLGLVQARWGHLNTNQSLLTVAQSIGIDGHFTIEQGARASGRLFMNFNGTAGIWRRQAIDDAGGWSSDTLTEDMDLSYRSQLVGWKAVFREDVVVPAELPDSPSAFKSQQFRWAKGSIQTACKLLPTILRSSFSLRYKIQSLFHLTHYSIHPLILILSVLALPVLLSTPINVSQVSIGLYLAIAIFMALGMTGPSAIYLFSQRHLYPKTWYRRLWFMPLLMVTGIGIAISNTCAVLEALCSRKVGEFVRTPKKGSGKKSNYKVKSKVHPFWEIALGLYCCASLGFYLNAGNYLIGPFLLIYASGFLYMGITSLREIQAYQRNQDAFEAEAETEASLSTQEPN